MLRAEPFSQQPGATTCEVGAKALPVDSPLRPNRHVVVFVRRDGQPVEEADVAIRYRELKPRE